MNERMNKQTNKQMNKWTYKQTVVPCVLQDFVPFGAAAQKARFGVWKGQIEAWVGRL